jgi:hypothetical protein
MLSVLIVDFDTKRSNPVSTLVDKDDSAEILELYKGGPQGEN